MKRTSGGLDAATEEEEHRRNGGSGGCSSGSCCPMWGRKERSCEEAET